MQPQRAGVGAGKDGTVRMACCIGPPLPPQGEPMGKKEPKSTRFLQQALPACKPMMEPIWVVFIYLAITVVCIPIGAVCLAYGMRPVEITHRYDQDCGFVNTTDLNHDGRQNFIWQQNKVNKSVECTVSIPITDDMPAPIYVLYEINGFNQNHRRYVVSRSDFQLIDKDPNPIAACKPQEYYMGDSNRPINPCGLTAWSYFNDTYAMSVVGPSSNAATPLNITSKGISPPSYRTYIFSNYNTTNFNPEDNQYRGGGKIDGLVGEDERFIVWMWLAPLPKFRKMWGKIWDQDLRAGDTLRIKISNQYNTYQFDGQKSIVLTTTNWLGGYNMFLGITFIVTGGLSTVVGLVYLIATQAKPRKMGDLTMLPQWVQEQVLGAHDRREGGN